jgi:hypothetical protein
MVGDNAMKGPLLTGRVTLGRASSRETTPDLLRLT